MYRIGGKSTKKNLGNRIKGDVSPPFFIYRQIKQDTYTQSCKNVVSYL